MLWLWILGGILVLLILLCLLRVGVRVSLEEEITVFLLIGPVRIRILPSGKDEKKDKPQPEPEKKSGGAKEKLKKIPKPSLEDIKDAYRTLKPAVVKALRRTRRGIRIHPLDISVTFGGREDPAGAAESYGYAQAAVWSVMPVLEQLLVIPAPHIHTGVDFDADGLQARGTAGISARVGTLLLVVLGAAIPAIRWFMKYDKRKRAETKTNHQPAEAPAA